MDSTVKLCFVSIWSFAKYLTAFRSRRVFRSLSNIYNETFFPKIINGSIVDARMSFKYASDLLSKIYCQYRFIQNHSRLFLAKDFSWQIFEQFQFALQRSVSKYYFLGSWKTVSVEKLIIVWTVSKYGVFSGLNFFFWFDGEIRTRKNSEFRNFSHSVW